MIALRNVVLSTAAMAATQQGVAALQLRGGSKRAADLTVKDLRAALKKPKNDKTLRAALVKEYEAAKGASPAANDEEEECAEEEKTPAEKMTVAQLRKALGKDSKDKSRKADLVAEYKGEKGDASGSEQAAKKTASKGKGKAKAAPAPKEAAEPEEEERLGSTWVTVEPPSIPEKTLKKVKGTLYTKIQREATQAVGEFLDADKFAKCPINLQRKCIAAIFGLSRSDFGEADLASAKENGFDYDAMKQAKRDFKNDGSATCQGGDGTGRNQRMFDEMRTGGAKKMQKVKGSASWDRRMQCVLGCHFNRVAHHEMVTAMLKWEGRASWVEAWIGWMDAHLIAGDCGMMLSSQWAQYKGFVPETILRSNK